MLRERCRITGRFWKGQRRSLRRWRWIKSLRLFFFGFYISLSLSPSLFPMLPVFRFFRFFIFTFLASLSLCARELGRNRLKGLWFKRKPNVCIWHPIPQWGAHEFLYSIFYDEFHSFNSISFV